MDGEGDCKKAVEEIKRDVPFANFKKTEDDANWPNGCYLYIKTGGVYFNTHSDGSRHNDARQICKSKGKKYNYMYYINYIYFVYMITNKNLIFMEDSLYLELYR